MELTMREYREKLLGCWNGKNAGGTLGAPLECKRGVFELTGYLQQPQGEPLPNDDLDLQLVWLNAAERYGREVDARILSEYWLNYVVPNWGEYGAGKNNLRLGLEPPLTGWYNNAYRNSNGAFILSEIWACLAPGHPEIAVRYACEDASVNHSGEGIYAAVFCAAVESSAFAESNRFRLLEIGLSYLPEDCGVTRGVREVLHAYRSGKTWKEARGILLNAVPGSFGCLGTPREEIPAGEPVGEIGWDAPSNIGILVLGLLYGEGDFSKSICIAAGCGEDADCTAGTLGALLGIIGGNASIPEKWLLPLGGKIKTLCVNTADKDLLIPQTVEELTERIERLLPAFLGGELCDCVGAREPGYRVLMREGKALSCAPQRINAWCEERFSDFLRLSPFTLRYDNPLFTALLDTGDGPEITAGTPKKLRLTVRNNVLAQQAVRVRWLLPQGCRVGPMAEMQFSLEQFHCNIGVFCTDFSLFLEQPAGACVEPVIEISSLGHPSRTYIPLHLICR